ncbi:MAG: hypothetical protein GY870_12395 [archaeon]|nr:hypothetical protein [archaeon]
MDDKNMKQVERFRGWVLGIINGIDARMLVDMIKSNDIPTLWEYELPNYLGFVKDMVVENRDTILEQLTLENVMTYCKQYRPDLAKILIHKKAQEWMNRFLKKIGFMIKHIELEPYEIQVKYEERIKELMQQRENTQADRIADMLSAPVIDIPPEAAELLQQVAPVPQIEKIEPDSLSDADFVTPPNRKGNDLDFI